MEIVRNKKAFFDYEILEKWDAGLLLTGNEVKAIRANQIQLKGGHIGFKNEEAWLENVQITPYQPKNQVDQNPTRKRKLLLKSSEIAKLSDQSNVKGITVVPLRIFIKNNKIKLEIGLCRGKKQYDKRQTIKTRDLDRQMRRNRS